MTEISLILPSDGTLVRPRSGRTLGGTPITIHTATVRLMFVSKSFGKSVKLHTSTWLGNDQETEIDSS